MFPETLAIFFVCNWVLGLFNRHDCVVVRASALQSVDLASFPELGTANLNSIPQPQIPQNCKRCSAIANPQVCDRFAVTFCTSATANAHSTSANLDRNIYCYFVFVKAKVNRTSVAFWFYSNKVSVPALKSRFKLACRNSVYYKSTN